MTDLAVDCKSHECDSLVFRSVQRMANKRVQKKGRGACFFAPTEQAQIAVRPLRNVLVEQ